MKLHSQAGFTLVELLVAAVLLTFGVLAAITVETSCIHGTSLASHLDEATALAQARLEQLRATADPTTLANSTENNLTPEGTAGGLYTRSASIATGPTANSRWVTVTVSWNGAFGSQQVTLQGIAKGGTP